MERTCCDEGGITAPPPTTSDTETDDDDDEEEDDDEDEETETLPDKTKKTGTKAREEQCGTGTGATCPSSHEDVTLKN